MSRITKELLQRNEDSQFKEVGIKFDSLSHYFYLSRAVIPPTLFGTREQIPIDHITDRIKSNADTMLNLSIVDTQLVRQTVGAGFVIYIRFPELDPTTRYHFFVGDGINNFNQRADINLPCGKLPDRFIVIEYGYQVWNNGTDNQQEQKELVDPNLQPTPDFQVEYLNVRFKIQTITLN